MRTRISLSIASQCLFFVLLLVCEAACGRSAIAQEVRSRQQVDASSTETTSEINKATHPAPVLYLPGDPSVATVPRTVAFTRKGGRYATGKIGQAISFDGNTYMELEASLPVGNNPRTIAFWVRNDRGPVKHIVQVVTQTVRWEKAKAFGIIEAGGKWRFHDMNGGLDSGFKIDPEWHHLAVTHDGKTIRFFLDGKKVAEADRNLETESRKLRIGGLGSPENNFVGLIDELYVFDVPLGEDQIRQLMNGAASSSTNGADGERTDDVGSIAHRISSRTFPSVFQAWGEAENLDGEDKWSTISRHDLVFHSPEFLGLRRNESHPGLATGFTENSIKTALERRAQLLEMNPQLVMLAELRYRDAHSSFLPANHEWWRRKDGKLVMGWAEGGYVQLDFSRPDFRTHVAQQAKAIMDTKVFDGIMLDWWADDDDRLELVKAIRRAIGDKPLILVNANDRRTPRTAPFVNGYFMECYRSRTPEDWRRIAETLQWAEKNLKVPRINCVETWYHESRKDLHLMRATTTLAMTLSDGYCLFSDPNSLPTPDHRHDWYEFWDQNLGKPKTAGVVQPDGHVVREFTGGTAVYNPFGNKPVTVQLATAHRQASTGHSGTRFVVPAGDGDIFLGEVAQASENSRHGRPTLRTDTTAAQRRDVPATTGTTQELFSQWKTPTEVTATTGRNRVLIPAGKHGLNYFPDEVICILKEAPLTFTVVADGTYVMQGRSFETAVPVGHVLKPGPPGSPDNHYAGIGGAFDDKARKRVMGFYHAEDKEGIGMVEVNGVQGFYGTICAAEASSNDTAFRKLGPAITADKPKLPRGWETEGGPKAAWMAQGVGEPTVCVDATGKYLLCYFVEWGNRLKRGVQICVARCPIETAGIPGSWRKYHNGTFSEAGLGGHETPVIFAGLQADTYNPHVQYVKEWDRYVMVFGVGVQSEIHSRPLKAVQSGLYVTTSQDGVNWTKPVQIEKVFAFVINTQECKIHPTLIVSRVTKDTLTGQLLYGYTPRWPDTPHHLGGCPITVKLRDQSDRRDLTGLLAGTKWVNSNNVSFEWTNDGKFLHAGKEREWKVLDESRVQIVFGPGHVDTLEFGDDLKNFKQLIKGGPSSFMGRRQ